MALIRFDVPGDTALRFTRAAAEAPFDAAITLSIDVLDADGVAGQGNPAVFDGAGLGIAFDGGPAIRYGRLRFDNAHGSEKVDLPVRFIAEYFVDAATGFLPNIDDTCTTDVSVGFLAYTGDLGPGETCVRDSGAPGASGAGCPAPSPAGLGFAAPPAAGDFRLRLAAPGAGNTGSVIVDSAVPDWLRFDWNAAIPGEENPAGIATFGLYGGDAAQIYLRELF
jgi:MSHA biogenesis protein MshQ